MSLIFNRPYTVGQEPKMVFRSGFGSPAAVVAEAPCCCYCCDGFRNWPDELTLSVLDISGCSAMVSSFLMKRTQTGAQGHSSRQYLSDEIYSGFCSPRAPRRVEFVCTNDPPSSNTIYAQDFVLPSFGSVVSTLVAFSCDPPYAEWTVTGWCCPAYRVIVTA